MHKVITDNTLMQRAHTQKILCVNCDAFTVKEWADVQMTE